MSNNLIALGARAMTANYAALQVTGNNIANVNTAGYSRQSVQLTTAYSQSTGSGFFGKGVDVATVTRAHSDFLAREAATTRSLAASDRARSVQLDRLETVFPLGESGIGYAATQVWSAFADIASKPQDRAAREAALARIDEMALRFRSASDQLDDIQSSVTGELKAAVASINTLTAQIAGLNQRIAETRGSGHSANELLDQRQLAIESLSDLVQVTTVPSNDGTVSVFLGGVQNLVLGGSSTPLAAAVDAFDPSRVQLGIREGPGIRTFPEGTAGAGLVAGLLRFQNHDLADARAQLGQMATAITSELNRRQSLGLDLGTPARFGGPLLAVGAPSVAPASTNAMASGVPVASYVNGQGVRVPSVSLTIVDAQALAASDYELVADPTLPAGDYRLVRRSDGSARTVSTGDVVDGFRIDIVAPLPAARDRFLLQPVSQSIRAMQGVLRDPTGIAAASPVVARADVSNTGTAAVRGISATDPSINPNLTATIAFTDDLGNYSWTLVDTTGLLPTTTGTGSFTAQQPIVLNGFALGLTGVPRTGDRLVVERTPYPASDNGNANATVALRDLGMVGKQTLASGSMVPGLTTSEAYAAMLGDIGVRVQSAQTVAQHSAVLATDAREAQSAKVGVNLDEEAARLLQFQQSYQAAARFLQVAQSIFDTLLDAAS
jgi:flagellar hook-associated protein 1 FlgK